MDRDKRAHPEDRDERDVERIDPLDKNETDEASDAVRPNPPRTTAGGWTSPKFGSSGSGGAELEPGPERD